MTTKFIGDTFTETERVVTGLYSLDWSLGDALNNYGWPLGSFVELYGPKNCGKTSFMLSISGILASKLGKDIVFLDWEGQDRNTVSGILDMMGFDGTVDYVLNTSKETSEKTAKRFVGKMYSENQPITLMDSLGAFRPTANMEGELNDANMGVMARESGRLADWIVYALHEAKEAGHSSCMMMTNHLHPKIGFRVVGNDTSGGEKKKYLAQLRIDLKRTWLKTKQSNGSDDDGGGGSIVDFGESWLLGGRIDSSRFGYSKREFQVFMIGGEGIHFGLSAVFDCLAMGLAEVSSKKVSESTTITMDGKQWGKLRTMIEHRDDPELFYAFENTLKAQQVSGNGHVSADVETEQKNEKKRRGRKAKK